MHLNQEDSDKNWKEWKQHINSLLGHQRKLSEWKEIVPKIWLLEYTIKFSRLLELLSKSRDERRARKAFYDEIIPIIVLADRLSPYKESCEIYIPEDTNNRDGTIIIDKESRKVECVSVGNDKNEADREKHLYIYSRASVFGEMEAHGKKNDRVINETPTRSRSVSSIEDSLLAALLGEFNKKKNKKYEPTTTLLIVISGQFIVLDEMSLNKVCLDFSEQLTAEDYSSFRDIFIVLSSEKSGLHRQHYLWDCRSCKQVLPNYIPTKSIKKRFLLRQRTDSVRCRRSLLSLLS